MQTFSTIGAVIPASGVIVNNLQGQPPEFFGEAATLTLYGNASAATSTHTLFGNRGSTSQVFVPPGTSLGVPSTASKVKTNEDFIGQYAIPAGTRLVHQISGVAAGTVNFIYVVT